MTGKYALTTCPKCGAGLICLGGESAHWSNWYCEKEGCGYEAWNSEKTAPTAIVEIQPHWRPLRDRFRAENPAVYDEQIPAIAEMLARLATLQGKTVNESVLVMTCGRELYGSAPVMISAMVELHDNPQGYGL